MNLAPHRLSREHSAMSLQGIRRPGAMPGRLNSNRDRKLGRQNGFDRSLAPCGFKAGVKNGLRRDAVTRPLRIHLPAVYGLGERPNQLSLLSTRPAIRIFCNRMPRCMTLHIEVTAVNIEHVLDEVENQFATEIRHDEIIKLEIPFAPAEPHQLLVFRNERAVKTGRYPVLKKQLG